MADLSGCQRPFRKSVTGKLSEAEEAGLSTDRANSEALVCKCLALNSTHSIRSHPLKDNALLKQQLSNCHSNSGKEGTVLSCDAPHSSDNNVSERDEQGRDHCKECEEHCVKSQQCVSITLSVQTVFDEVVLELKQNTPLKLDGLVSIA
jgi:hypothetical protein